MVAFGLNLVHLAQNVLAVATEGGIGQTQRLVELVIEQQGLVKDYLGVWTFQNLQKGLVEEFYLANAPLALLRIHRLRRVHKTLHVEVNLAAHVTGILCDYLCLVLDWLLFGLLLLCLLQDDDPVRLLVENLEETVLLMASHFLLCKNGHLRI